MKQCTTCGEAKELAAYPADRRATDGRGARCNTCRSSWRAENRDHVLATEAAWRKANPHKVRQYKERHRAASHGLTVAQYRELEQRHAGECAICKRPFPGTPHIDHDHACCPGATGCSKCVRGLLCPKCNTKLSPVEDVAWLTAAVEYLKVTGVRPL